jgi:hypothetical protein
VVALIGRAEQSPLWGKAPPLRRSKRQLHVPKPHAKSILQHILANETIIHERAAGRTQVADDPPFAHLHDFRVQGRD